VWDLEIDRQPDWTDKCLLALLACALSPNFLLLQFNSIHANPQALSIKGWVAGRYVAHVSAYVSDRVRTFAPSLAHVIRKYAV